MGNENNYGVGDTTFIALGGSNGIRAVVNEFYDSMETNPDYQVIWNMHTEDHETMRDKLTLFLCIWSGGPNDYKKKYGPISIPMAHKHLKVTTSERDDWLNCMHGALRDKSLPTELIDYLMIQLARPAESIRRHCNIQV